MAGGGFKVMIPSSGRTIDLCRPDNN